MKQLTEKFGKINHDFEVNYINNDAQERVYVEYITKLQIKGKGKRVNRDVVDITRNGLEVIQDIDIFGLLGCIESFGSELDIDIEEDEEKVKEYKEQEQKAKEKKEKKSKGKDKKKKKEDTKKKFEESMLDDGDLEEWNEKSKKAFKSEIVKLRKIRKKLGISKDELEPYVNKFSKSNFNPTGEELDGFKDILPKNIKQFNKYMIKQIQRKRNS
jgi:anaerobic selenocysteine-containing dehydrogenase